MAWRRSGGRAPSAPLPACRLGRVGWRRLEDALRGLAPQLLEPVEVTRVGGEDVGDHVEVVEEDRARLGQALDPPGEQSVLLLHPFEDRVVDGLGLALGVARADDEPVRVAEDAGEVEQRDVAGLAVARVACDALGEVLARQRAGWAARGPYAHAVT